MKPTRALTAARLHDGTRLLSDQAVLVADGIVTACVPRGSVPEDLPVEEFGAGILAPGFVDLQVNGGGGVMFNDDRSVAALRRIADAHGKTGTAAILPTLITDTPDHVTEAIAAAQQAVDEKVPGIAGLHLEGPHLSVARKGAHDPDLIRPMTDADLLELCDAADALPTLMVTVAPETVTASQIAALAEAGAVVSMGHSDADFATCRAAEDAGATCVTHLFNAMSQLGNREPGLVGTTLNSGALNCGLIADGIHVHPATMATALRAKTGPGEIFLVTDAMSTVGSDITEFTLNGRRILRRDGRLTLADGTLAGADLTMPQAIRVMVDAVGIGVETALRMAIGAPASMLRHSGGLGTFAPGAPARFVYLDQASNARPVIG